MEFLLHLNNVYLLNYKQYNLENRLINSETNIIRLEIVKNRDLETLKSILTKYVRIGNYKGTDAWNGYSFLKPCKFRFFSSCL